MHDTAHIHVYSLVGYGVQRFVWEIMKKSWVWNDFLKNMCSKDITQKLDSFGEALFFYPVANTFSQTNCQIPYVNIDSLVRNLVIQQIRETTLSVRYDMYAKFHGLFISSIGQSFISTCLLITQSLLVTHTDPSTSGWPTTGQPGEYNTSPYTTFIHVAIGSCTFNKYRCKLLTPVDVTGYHNGLVLDQDVYYYCKINTLIYWCNNKNNTCTCWLRMSYQSHCHTSHWVSRNSYTHFQG